MRREREKREREAERESDGERAVDWEYPLLLVVHIIFSRHNEVAISAVCLSRG